MDRYFAANVGITPPVLGTAVKGYPQDGNLGAGTIATIPGAYAFWQVYAEMLGLITDAGETPDPSNLTQVATAVHTIASSAAAAAQSAAIAAAASDATTKANAAQAAAIAAAATDATTKANAARTGAVSDVNAEFTGAHQNLAPALGFQDYPGGRTHQWVEQFVAGALTTSVTVNYQKAFTGTPPIPQVTIMDASLSGGSSNFLGFGVVSRSLSGCVIAFGPNGGSARDITVRVDVWGAT